PIFEALLSYNPKVDDIEILTSGKTSDQGVLIKLPIKNVSFFVGPNFCRFSRGAFAWNLAEETITILETSLLALERETGIARGLHHTAIGLHLQMQKVSFQDILRPLAAQPLLALSTEPFATMAVVVKWPRRKITLDGSNTIANAIFVKLEREFP